MTLKINTVAPDFKAKTQLGDISFHEWLGGRDEIRDQ